MNQKLTEAISYHILANLGILPSDFVNIDKTRLLIDKQFMLTEKISFSIENEVIQKNVFGAQTTISNKEFKLLLADVSIQDSPAYCLISSLEGSPIFAIYLITGSSIDNQEAMIAVNNDKKHWMPCTIYLQATYLAGMEQLRDLSFPWIKIKNYKELYNQLLTFIKFHDNYFEES